MITGIVGLGLIGGSFAKAYHEKEHKVYAFDVDSTAMSFALCSEIIDSELNKDNISECDLILVCIYPEAAINYIKNMAPYINKTTTVIDCCGIKEKVCEELFPVAEKYGFTYIGGHPMAGTQYSGIKYSRSNLYHNAPMVLVPNTYDPYILSHAKELLAPAEFGTISITTADDHDRIIAFSSQMAHIASNAYVKSPTAIEHKGFSAGSYKDMTRVAWLNSKMWAELFIDNQKHLLPELDSYIKSLEQYKIALENMDTKKLIELLEEGKIRKEKIDGR